MIHTCSWQVWEIHFLCINLEQWKGRGKVWEPWKLLPFVCNMHQTVVNSRLRFRVKPLSQAVIQFSSHMIIFLWSLMMKRAVWKEQQRVSHHCNYYSDISPLLIKIMSHSSSFRLNLLPGKSANYCHYSSVPRSSDHT